MDCGAGTLSQSLALTGERAYLVQRKIGERNCRSQRREHVHQDSLQEGWHRADAVDPWARLLGARTGLRTGSPEEKKTVCCHEHQGKLNECPKSLWQWT